MLTKQCTTMSAADIAITLQLLQASYDGLLPVSRPQLLPYLPPLHVCDCYSGGSWLNVWSRPGRFQLMALQTVG